MSVLCVAASGGHLAQLNDLSARIPGYGEDAVWVTFDTPQSVSMMRGRRHVFVPYTNSRDWATAIRNMRIAGRVIRSAKPSLVVSTGNAVAFSFLPVARAFGVPSAYIESAARADGPSLTGKLMQRVPGVQLFSQYESWASDRWRYVGSIFDQFEPADREPGPVLKVLVTLGTMTFGFPRLVERVREIIPAGCQVVWQVGSTNVDGMGLNAQASMPAHELQAEIERADVIIAHAGIGSALGVLQAGKCPILVPRERAYGEHVDDHQRQIAADLTRRGLAVGRRVAELQTQDLELVNARSVLRRHLLPELAIDV